MLPIHTILHPTDFSEPSEFAFRLACSLARDYRAKLIVLHVVHLPVAVYGEGAVVANSPEYDEELRASLQRIEAPPGIELVHRLEEGVPAEEIVTVAGIVAADLIVMGTHGRRGLKRLLMGSVAEQVLRQAACPVLTVRSPFPLTVPEAESEGVGLAMAQSAAE